jgi:hypothetical protein
MSELIQVLIAVAIAYAYAAAAKPALQLSGKRSRAVAIGIGLLVLLCPLLIAPEHVVHRAITALFVTDLSLKMLDYARQYPHRRGEPVSYRMYLRFLIPFPVLLVVFGERERPLPGPPPLVRELAIISLTGALVAACCASLPVVAKISAVRASFPLDHVIKVTIFAITVESLSRFLWGLERLARFDTKPIIDRAYLSTTPGEFWHRYNTRVGSWLDRNVFRPSGGLRAPVRGVFLAFFVSALLHELMFGIATSRLTGCQFAFFILQAPAVVLSHRAAAKINRSGPAIKMIARGLTAVWFYVTSIFFFEGVNRIFPFVYASQPWLP